MSRKEQPEPEMVTIETWRCKGDKCERIKITCPFKGWELANYLRELSDAKPLPMDFAPRSP